MQYGLEFATISSTKDFKRRWGEMKALRFIAAVSFILLMSVSAYGATLYYSPGVYVTVPAGSEQEIPMTISIDETGYGTYYLWFADSIEGNLPIEWVEPSPGTSFISKWWNNARTTLTIKVPEDAEPGTYTGHLYAKAKRSHAYADEGDGMYIEVHVLSDCGGKPEVQINSFGPEYLWPPNGSMEEVTVQGTVSTPDGCTLFEAGYSVDDEYGEYSGVGEFTVGGGGDFSIIIPVEASRDGRDKDGRNYIITLYGEDEAGIGISQGIEVLVPHDQRKK
jgi:hypothetical protein